MTLTIIFEGQEVDSKPMLLASVSVDRHDSSVPYFYLQLVDFKSWEVFHVSSELIKTLSQLQVVLFLT